MGAKAQRDSSEKFAQRDWLSRLRLRIQLLAVNPYFQAEVREARKTLGIPPDGYSTAQEGFGWLNGHLATHGQPNWGSGQQLPKATPEQVELTLFLAAAESRSYGKKPLPVVQAAKDLIAAYQLPTNVVGPVAWHVITGEPVSPDAFTTVVVEKVEPGWVYPDSGGENAIEAEIWERFKSGLPEGVPGDIVVVRMLVNEYTTKMEFYRAWRHVEAIRNSRHGTAPSRRRRGKTLAKYKSWLPAYRAHRVEGKSLYEVADKYDVDLDKLKYRIKQLDQVLRPTEK